MNSAKLFFLLLMSSLALSQGALSAPLQCRSVHMDQYWQEALFENASVLGIKTSQRLRHRLVQRWTKLLTKNEISESQIHQLSTEFLSILQRRGLANYASRYLRSGTEKRVQLTQEFERQILSILEARGASFSQGHIQLIQKHLIRKSHWISWVAWTANHSLSTLIGFTTTGAFQPAVLYTPKLAHEAYAQLSRNQIKLKSFEKIVDSYYNTFLTLVIVYALVSNTDEIHNFSNLFNQLTEESSDRMNAIEVQNEVQTQVLRDLSESSIMSAEEALTEYLKSQD